MGTNLALTLAALCFMTGDRRHPVLGGWVRELFRKGCLEPPRLLPPVDDGTVERASPVVTSPGGCRRQTPGINFLSSSPRTYELSISCTSCNLQLATNLQTAGTHILCTPTSILQERRHHYTRSMGLIQEVDEESGLITKATVPVEGTSLASFESSISRMFSPLQVVRIPFIRSTRSTGSLLSYDSFDQTDDDFSHARNIRFQVVVWNVGRPDEVLGKVEMKFRVTIFWNNMDENDDNNDVGYGMNNPFNKKVWKMHGRQRAYQTEISGVGAEDKIVYVPPVSILNAVDFEFLGEPEVCQLNSEENLMKWTCLYKASLIQEDMHVSDFPHDSHNLVLRLGILKHRQARKRWDKNRWKLSLATEEDTLETIDTPHGTIVDHVHVPGYSYDRQRGLDFEFLPLEHGSRNKLNSHDRCLQVKLRVTRESSYYDRNIVPLLAALNTVGICTLALNADKFGARGEMILATAFVEIGIRMTVDSRLPVVGYQIKMQWLLNNFFFGLLFLVCESSIAYLLYQHGYKAKFIDQVAATAELLHMLFVLFIYMGKGKLFENSCVNCFKKNQSS